MTWFDTLRSPKIKSPQKKSSQTPDGLWVRCPQCHELFQSPQIQENLQVCPSCDYHYRWKAQQRLADLLDPGTFQSFSPPLFSTDPLEFSDKKPYRQRIKDQIALTKIQQQQAHPPVYEDKTTLSGKGLIRSMEVSLCIMDFEDMGGSMGVATGEKISLCLEYALNNKIPAIVFSCSGGARMQEGLVSLMQMAKTSSLIAQLKSSGIPYISVLLDPTTGGCAASFAMLGDINLAEPKALIGFAGPRVIEQSIRQVLPDGFQRSEFLLEHGQIDGIIHRKNMREELAFYIQFYYRNQNFLYV